MSTFYLDYEGGNDANDGTTFANRWKTLTSGATAARIAAGDTIRIMKSPDPTSLGINATWTNKDDDVTLASAVTQAIYNDGAWTASANVTATTTTTRKEGSNASNIAIAAGFNTGLAAYYATGTLDLSAYKQLSFWIRQTSGNLAANVSLRLCSDAVGAVSVATFNIPALGATGVWSPMTIDLGSALPSSVASIALYVDSDQAAQTFIIDNIMACKDSTAADSLSLTSLIGKNSAGETWYPIKSIVGTAIKLDQGTSQAANVAARGYSGSTGSATIYKRETIKTTMVAASTTDVQAIQDSGSVGSRITFSGGWDRTNMSTQDGETWWDGQNGFGDGIDVSSRSSIAFSKISCVRYNNGFAVTFGSKLANITFDASCHAVGNSNNGLDISGNNAHNGNGATALNFGHANSNGASGIQVNFITRGLNIGTVESCNSNGDRGLRVLNAGTVYGYFKAGKNNASYGLGLDSLAYNCRIKADEIKDNGAQGIAFGFTSASHGNVVLDATVSGNTTASVILATADNVPGLNNGLVNCLLSDATEFSVPTAIENIWFYSDRHDQVAGAFKAVTHGGILESETSVRHTASGIAWKCSVTSTDRGEGVPVRFPIARIACAASALVTVKVWMRRSNTGLTAQLVCRGGQIQGVSSDQVAAMTAAADTWEELTITFTPSEAGVVEIEALFYGGSTYLGYVDDLTVTQA